MKRYNGWSNWETWNAYNWISSDENTYGHAQLVALAGQHAFEAFMWEYVLGDTPEASLAFDYLITSYEQIDMDELYKAVKDE